MSLGSAHASGCWRKLSCRLQRPIPACGPPCTNANLLVVKHIYIAGIHVGHEDVQITNSLRAAKNCKQRLENDLHKASETGGTTIGTTVGTPMIGSGG